MLLYGKVPICRILEFIFLDLFQIIDWILSTKIVEFSSVELWNVMKLLAEERRLSMKPEMIWSRYLSFPWSTDNFVWNDLPLLMKHDCTIRNQRPNKSLVRVVDDQRNSGYNKNQQERLRLWVLKTRRLINSWLSEGPNSNDYPNLLCQLKEVLNLRNFFETIHLFRRQAKQ